MEEIKEIAEDLENLLSERIENAKTVEEKHLFLYYRSKINLIKQITDDR